MTLNENKKLAKAILRLLKVDEVIFPICRTSKGNFGLRYGVNAEDYEMYLDAVPLSTKDFLKDENNIELKKLLEKYLFEAPFINQVITGVREEKIVVMPDPIVAPDKPKRGRPKGSKNKNGDKPTSNP